MLDENAAIELAIEAIQRHEGCELTAYPDPESPRGKQLRLPEDKRVDGWAQLSGAPWTIGYGSTHGVFAGMEITAQEAVYRLRIDLQLSINELKAKINGVYTELTNHQAAALFDFVFNLGTGNPRKPEWTIWKVLRARRFDQVPGELVKFVKAGGVKVHGLVLRRNDEIAMWSTGEPGSVPDTLPSATTRVIATPPTPVDPVPAVKSVHVWTTALGSLAAIPVIVKNGADTLHNWLSPYAGVGLIDQTLTYCTLAAAGAVVAAGVWAWAGKRFLRN